MWPFRRRRRGGRHGYVLPERKVTIVRDDCGNEIRLVNVHDHTKCRGRPCTVHNPSDHHMRHMPLIWRGDWGGFFERLCPHGVGHPDPDQITYWTEIGRGGCASHGCCHMRCCSNEPPFFRDSNGKLHLGRP